MTIIKNVQFFVQKAIWNHSEGKFCSIYEWPCNLFIEGVKKLHSSQKHSPVSLSPMLILCLINIHMLYVYNTFCSVSFFHTYHMHILNSPCFHFILWPNFTFIEKITLCRIADKNNQKYRGSPDSTVFAPPGNCTIEKTVLFWGLI